MVSEKKYWLLLLFILIEFYLITYTCICKPRKSSLWIRYTIDIHSIQAWKNLTWCEKPEVWLTSWIFALQHNLEDGWALTWKILPLFPGGHLCIIIAEMLHVLYHFDLKAKNLINTCLSILKVKIVALINPLNL